MPGNLARFLPFLDEATRAELFGSILLAVKYPLGDPIRTGVIQGGQASHVFCRFFHLSRSAPAAYGETMKIMTIVATVVAIFPPIFALLLPDLYLGDGQNAVDETDLGGEKARRK